MDILQPEYHLNSKICIYNFGVIKNNTRFVKKCNPVSGTVYFMVASLAQWETESTRKTYITTHVLREFPRPSPRRPNSPHRVKLLCDSFHFHSTGEIDWPRNTTLRPSQTPASSVAPSLFKHFPMTYQSLFNPV